MDSELLAPTRESHQYPNAGSVSPCENLCQSEQSALVSCMDSIREHTIKQVPDKEEHNRRACLKPMLDAWTTCCSKANTSEVDQ
mmetsp:Transcript_10324/g.14601  ORF Transcript_10324/g.14601 Transcript_10324/m.14601 type:complete len:84 (-) Transcript_10324:195-446(-)